MREDNDFFNRLNPHSFINLLPEKLRNMILEIDEEYWELTERELISKAHGRDATKLPELDTKIRLSLWKEYDFRSKSQYVTPMTAVDFLKGLLPANVFYKEMAKNPARLKILIIEPADTWVKYEDILQLSIPEMRKILELEHGINMKTGLPGYELLKLKFEIFQYLDARQHGAITKNIRTESKNINVEVSAGDLKKFRSIEEIDAEIAKLENKSKVALIDSRPLLQPLMEMPKERAAELLAIEEKD